MKNIPIQPLHVILLVAILLFTGISVRNYQRLTPQQKFWRYFVQHQDFYYSYSNKDYSEENKKKLNDLGHELAVINPGFSYELLPTEEDGRRGFVITGDNKAELVPQVSEMVRNAPYLEKWHIYAFKQRKEIGKISIVNQTKGYRLGIEDVFFTYSTSTQFDLKLYMSGSPPYKEYEYLYLLDNIIGEEDLIRNVWISGVFPKGEAPKNEKLLPIMELRKIIDDAGPCGAIPKEHCFFD